MVRFLHLVFRFGCPRAAGQPVYSHLSVRAQSVNLILQNRTAPIRGSLLIPGLLQIGRHALAHHAEADEADAHLFPPPIVKLLRTSLWPRATLLSQAAARGILRECAGFGANG